jgi:23S rRNA pseudouridine1911/1915/1917 synthase
VGDPVYRPRKFLKNIPKIYSEIPSTTVSLIKSVKRQMLHALQLRFSHPHSGEMLSFESPIPQDMEGLLNKLRVVT